METDCVVGSGPAGVACAAALLKRGRTVLMLDAGLRLETERAEVVKRLAAQSPSEWSVADISRLKEGMNPGAKGIPQKLLYGSDYPYRNAERELGLQSSNVGLQASLAIGGLSTVWGAAMMGYHDRDLADWPIRTSHLAPHYRAVLELVKISAGRDGLEELFPLYTDTPTQLQMSRQATAVWQKLERHAELLKQRGIHYGRARVAIQAKRTEGEAGCLHCGYCMYGCPYGYIFNSADIVAGWHDQQLFKYQRDIVVETVQEQSEGVLIRGHRQGTNEHFETRVKRVYLAAGVIPTTGILLRSLGLWGEHATIKDSQYFLLPALLPRRISGVRQEALHALSQIFVELLDDQTSRNTVHLQLYTHNDLIGRAVRNMFGPLQRPLDFLAREMEGRLILLQGFLHSNESSQIDVILKHPNAGGQLELTPNLNPRARKVVGKVTRKLLRNFHQLGAVALPMMLQFATPGRSFHAGGSFPMRGYPGKFETDPLGRPAGLRRVHAVDATVFPSIPATTITFSVMANAHRIATETPID